MHIKQHLNGFENVEYYLIRKTLLTINVRKTLEEQEDLKRKKKMNKLTVCSIE